MTLYPGYKCDNIRIGDYRIEYIDKSWNNLLSWMILQRGRLRSKLKPFGFDPQEVHTARGNRLAIREAFLIHLCIQFGPLVSCEQPGKSMMYRLEIFQRLLGKGMLSLRFPFCNWKTVLVAFKQSFSGKLAGCLPVWPFGNHFRVPFRARCRGGGSGVCHGMREAPAGGFLCSAPWLCLHLPQQHEVEKAGRRQEDRSCVHMRFAVEKFFSWGPTASRQKLGWQPCPIWVRKDPEGRAQEGEPWRPSVTQVFGREPRCGEHVASFSGRYPITLCSHFAEMLGGWPLKLKYLTIFLNWFLVWNMCRFPSYLEVTFLFSAGLNYQPAISNNHCCSGQMIMTLLAGHSRYDARWGIWFPEIGPHKSGFRFLPNCPSL